jgi:hypothetical protein
MSRFVGVLFVAKRHTFLGDFFACYKKRLCATQRQYHAFSLAHVAGYYRSLEE